MNNWLDVLIGGVIGAALIVLNQHFMAWMAKRKERNKLKIWNALTIDNTLSPREIASKIELDENNVTALLYEMLRDGTIDSHNIDQGDPGFCKRNTLRVPPRQATMFASERQE